MSKLNPISIGINYVFLGPKKWLEVKEDYKNRRCAVCEKPKKDFDKYMRLYCSEKCRDKFNSKLMWPDKLRDLTLIRDKYTCVKCGYVDKLDKHGAYNNLQADHIIAKMNGGAEWDINNMQTLCNDCHKLKTKQDHEDRIIDIKNSGMVNLYEYTNL